jgi:hypothetical protein
MVKKIVSNLRESRDIVLSAQELVNEKFNFNANSLSGQLQKNSFEQKLNNFIKTVKASVFLSDEEKKIVDQKPEEIYEFARGIILGLVKTEIKNPLTK